MVDKVTLSTLPVTDAGNLPRRNDAASAAPGDTGFEEALRVSLGASSGVRFSAHAQRRLEARHIDFGSEEAVRLERAVDKAASKGARASLVLMDDLALVVSVRNRVVITAVDAASRKEDVFTNIDSVVLT